MNTLLSAAPWPYPFWIAHRGAGTLAPENTLAAFEQGADLGFAMFECDVQLSADGVPFLLHDLHLSRTTNGQGLAADQTWACFLFFGIKFFKTSVFEVVKFPTSG